MSVASEFDAIKDLVLSLQSNVSTIVSSHHDLSTSLKSIIDNLSNISVSNNELSTLLESIGKKMKNFSESQDEMSARILVLESIANYSVTLQDGISAVMKSLNDSIANFPTNNSEGKNSPICSSSEHTNDTRNIEREMSVQENISSIKSMLWGFFVTTIVVTVFIVVYLYYILSKKIESIKAKDEKVAQFKAEGDGEANVRIN